MTKPPYRHQGPTVITNGEVIKVYHTNISGNNDNYLDIQEHPQEQTFLIYCGSELTSKGCRNSE